MPGFPDPDRLHPITLPDGRPHTGTVMLRVALDHPNIHVGPYTYASETEPPDDAAGWAARIAPWLYPGAPDHLHIGRFGQIASGVRFVTASASHDAHALSTYPFAVFDPDRMRGFTPDIRDTVVGHDVWIGAGAMICPGARVGDGAILGAGSVVRGTVPPYAVVAGNPARPLRMRHGAADIARLSRLRWWNWPRDVLIGAADALMARDIDALEDCAPKTGAG
jgi:virginiamycin A acetyltransferase